MATYIYRAALYVVRLNRPLFACLDTNLHQVTQRDQEESLLVAVLQPNKIGANPFLLHLSYSQPNRNTTQKQIRNPGGWSLCQHLMSGTFRFVSNQQDGTCANSRARIKPDTFPGSTAKTEGAKHRLLSGTRKCLIGSAPGTFQGTFKSVNNYQQPFAHVHRGSPSAVWDQRSTEKAS